MTPRTFRDQRLRHGWTIQDLADRCAKEGQTVSIQQLGKIERGVHSPRPRLRAVLSRLLEIEDHDLPAYRRPGRRTPAGEDGERDHRFADAVHRQSDSTAEVQGLVTERLGELRDDAAERQRHRDAR